MTSDDQSKRTLVLTRRLAVKFATAAGLLGTSAGVPLLTGCTPSDDTFVIPVDVNEAELSLHIDEGVVVPASTRKIAVFIRTPGYKFYFSRGNENNDSLMYDVPRLRVGKQARQRLKQTFLGDGRWAEVDVKLQSKEYLQINLFVIRKKNSGHYESKDGVTILAEGDCGGSGCLAID